MQHNTVSGKVRLLNFLRQAFKIPLLEQELARRTQGKPPDSFICKFVPNPYQYAPNSFRVVNRNGLSLRVDISDYIAVFKSKTELEQVKELSKMIQESGLSDETIRKSLSDKRKDSLIIFQSLLNETSAITEYKEKFSIRELGEECVWHHFLKNNPWILGLSVDIRFIRDFYPETNSGISNTDGKGSPEVDMTGIRDYTVLIELKTSETLIFTEKKRSSSRANTWSFSDDFIDGVSQCLGQKFDWDKGHKSKDLTDPKNGTVLSQDKIRTVDPKTIFIIGNKEKEIPEDRNSAHNFLKRDTFERFRRNNRNIEIVTFDELYERAYFIVHGVQLRKNIYEQ
jgi:hypothetical protein